MSAPSSLIDGVQIVCELVPELPRLRPLRRPHHLLHRLCAKGQAQRARQTHIAERRLAALLPWQGKARAPRRRTPHTPRAAGTARGRRWCGTPSKGTGPAGGGSASHASVLSRGSAPPVGRASAPCGPAAAARRWAAPRQQGRGAPQTDSRGTAAPAHLHCLCLCVRVLGGEDFLVTLHSLQVGDGLRLVALERDEQVDVAHRQLAARRLGRPCRAAAAAPLRAAALCCRSLCHGCRDAWTGRTQARSEQARPSGTGRRRHCAQRAGGGRSGWFGAPRA